MQGCKCCKYFQDEISLLPCPLRGGFKNEDKLALETSIEQPSRHWTGWKTQDGKTNICWNWNQRCFVSRKIFLISLQLINGTRLSRFVLLKLASGKKVRVWSKIECWDVAKDNSAARLPPWWLGFLSAASDCLSWSVFWRSGARVQRGRYRQPHLLINKLPLSRQLQAGHQLGTSAHTGSGSRGRDHGGEVARARVTASWRSRPRTWGSSLKAGVLSARTVMAPPRLVTISRPRRAPAWLAASPAPRRCLPLVGAAPPRATSCQFRSCDWLAGVRWAGLRVTSVHPSSWLLFTAAGGAAADIFPFFEWAGLCYLGAGRHIAGVWLWVRTNNGLTIPSTTRYNLK